MGMLHDIAIVKCFIPRKNRLKSAKSCSNYGMVEEDSPGVPAEFCPTRFGRLKCAIFSKSIECGPYSKPSSHPTSKQQDYGPSDKLIAAPAQPDRQDHY